MSIFGKTASESKSLSNVLRLVHYVEGEIKKGHDYRSVEPFLEEIKETLEQFRWMASRGIHHNPPLTVFAVNPPESMRLRVVGKIGKNVHDIRYTHAENGEDFEHIFETGKTKALAVEGQGIRRSVLLTGPDDIWDHY